jgi:hypothetical protein
MLNTKGFLALPLYVLHRGLPPLPRPRSAYGLLSKFTSCRTRWESAYDGGVLPTSFNAPFSPGSCSPLCSCSPAVCMPICSPQEAPAPHPTTRFVTASDNWIRHRIRQPDSSPHPTTGFVTASDNWIRHRIRQLDSSPHPTTRFVTAFDTTACDVEHADYEA